MSGRLLRSGLFAGGVVVIALLPVIGRSLRADGDPRCALDGLRIPAATRVHLVEASGAERDFCTVECAAGWLLRTAPIVQSLEVTDETTGSKVPVADAWFVRSRVPTYAPRGATIHVFATEAAAREHAASFNGDVLEGDDRPLSLQGGGKR